MKSKPVTKNYEQDKYQTARIRISPYESKIFTEAKQELRLSVKAVISQLCHICDVSEFVIYNKDKSKRMVINKNFLCKKR